MRNAYDLDHSVNSPGDAPMGEVASRLISRGVNCPLPTLNDGEADKRDGCKYRADRKGGGRPEHIPKHPGHDTCKQHGNAARKIEYPERGASELRGCGVSHQSSKESLGQSHMKSPKHHAKHDKRNSRA